MNTFFLIIFFFLMFIYFEGEGERESRGGGERGERESQAVSTEPDVGLEPTNHEIIT